MADDTSPASQVDSALASAGSSDVDTALNNAQAPVAAPVRAPATPQQQFEQKPVNVFNPSGEIVSIPQAQLYDAINAGYRPASDEDIAKADQQDKYGSTGQQLLTGIEGAADAATFGTAGELEDIGSSLGVPGISGADRLARREENPLSRTAGEVAGLAGTSFIPGVGEAGLLRDAGEGVAGAVGLAAPTTVLGRIGSASAKLATEGALMGAGDQVSRMIAQDPNQTAQTALAGIGLSAVGSGILGGAGSAISPLWKAAMGSKVGSLLGGIASKVGGIEGVVPDSVNEAIQASGMQVAPEIKAALSNDPNATRMFQHLQESATGSGEKAQQALQGFRDDASNALVNAVGKSPEDVANLETLSDYDAGTNLKTALVKQLKDTIDPISEQFESVKSKFKDTELPTEAKADIGTKIGNLVSQERYNLDPSSPQAKIIQKALDVLPNIKSLEDLRAYTSQIGENANAPELWRVGKQLKGIFRDAEESTLTQTIGDKAPELLEQHALARGAYKNAMDTVDTLNDRLRVGRYQGPGSFISALKDMAPEDVLRRLSPKGDAGIIGELSTKFPEAAAQIKDYHLSAALKAAGARSGPNEAINSKVFLSALEKMSPEMRSFVLPEGSAPKIEALGQLINAIPGKMNNSGTAKTLDSLWQKVPESATALITMIAGHNPVTAVIAGKMAKLLGRDAPDAVKLSMLKFLGTDKSVDSSAFKSMFDYMHNTIKGENLTGRATKAIFKAGADVLPMHAMPTESDRKKLDKQVAEMQKSPQAMLNGDTSLAHYMPDHHMAMTSTAANAYSYLNQMRPNTDKTSPLDTPRKATAAQQADYNRVLDIAQQPLVVMSKLKDGTLNSKDVLALQHMYPDMYTKLRGQLMEQITGKGEEPIPYKTRQALSLFMATPLDSTMTPSGIMAAQPQPPQGQQQTATQPASGPKSSTKGLGKMATMSQTASQSAEANRAKH